MFNGVLSFITIHELWLCGCVGLFIASYIGLPYCQYIGGSGLLVTEAGHVP